MNVDKEKFTVSRNFFKRVLHELCKAMNETYIDSDTSPEATLWRNSGLNENSRWKNLVQFVETHGSFQQSGAALIPKLIEKLPVISTIFHFEYQSNGKAIASRITTDTPKDGNPMDTKSVKTDTSKDENQWTQNRLNRNKTIIQKVPVMETVRLQVTRVVTTPKWKR